MAMVTVHFGTRYEDLGRTVLFSIGSVWYGLGSAMRSSPVWPGGIRRHKIDRMSGSHAFLTKLRAVATLTLVGSLPILTVAAVGQGLDAVLATPNRQTPVPQDNAMANAPDLMSDPNRQGESHLESAWRLSAMSVQRL